MTHDPQVADSVDRVVTIRDGKTHMNWEELAPGFVLECLGPIDPEMFVLADDQLGYSQMRERLLGGLDERMLGRAHCTVIWTSTTCPG